MRCPHLVRDRLAERSGPRRDLQLHREKLVVSGHHEICPSAKDRDFGHGAKPERLKVIHDRAEKLDLSHDPATCSAIKCVAAGTVKVKR